MIFESQKCPRTLNYVQKMQKYHQEHQPFQKAGCIVFDLEFKNVIIVKNRMSFEKGENKHGLPKGQIKMNEEPRDAAQRELYEETGLKIHLTENNDTIQIFDILYYVVFIDKKEFKDFKPVDNVEIISSEWMDVDNLKYLTLNRSLFKIVQIWDNIFNK